MSDEAPNSEPREDARMPLPPASFTFIVLSLRAQAEMQLGLMQFDEEQKPEPDLVMARHTIDLMAVLLEKTRGNLELGRTAPAGKLPHRIAVPFRAGFR